MLSLKAFYNIKKKIFQSLQLFNLFQIIIYFIQQLYFYESVSGKYNKPV